MQQKEKVLKSSLLQTSRQLLPVGVGKCIWEYDTTKKINNVEIEEIRRQKYARDVNLLQSVKESVKGEIKESFKLLDKSIKEISKQKERRLTAIVNEYVGLAHDQKRNDYSNGL